MTTENLDDSAADGLTPGERAYLDSGGSDVEKLLAENTGGAGGTAAGAAEVKDASVADAGAKTPEPAKEAPAAAVPGEKKAGAEVAGADEDDEPADPKAATIPYQKYQRETKKYKDRLAATEKSLAEMNEKFARGDERLKLLSEVMTPQAQAEPAAEEDPEPDPNQDLIAWANWSRRDRARLQETVTQTRDTVSGTANEQAMREGYQRDAVAFAQENPDFGGAYNHLLTVRAAMLQEQGHSEKEIRQILHAEEKGLVERAFKAGKRPAELVYGMAQRLGWQKPAPAADPAPAPAAAAAAARPAAATQQQQPSVVEEIERIQRGQEASKSLSDAGGAPQELSVEALASMSESDFNALYAKKKSQVDTLLGKRAH